MEEARVLVDAKALDPESPDPFGVIGQTLLGRYHVQRVAGRGGQGIVYEAEHERLKRPVAIKFLLVDATEGPTALRRFEREAEILAKLSHPSIVHIYDIATHADGETPLMVMEFVRGESLSVRLQDRKRTPWREAFALAAQAASALAAAHAQDIIHRDIKPDNLIVCEEGTLKVLDFGIAQLITELSNTDDGRAPRRRLTAKNMVPGTAGYMSPEQFVAGLRLDGRSDVYSLGVVLYRLLSAKRLWPTVERHEIAQLVQTQNPPDIQSQVPELPDHAAQVVRRALERDRGQRFASMEAMRDALLASLEDEAATTTMAVGAEVSPPEVPGVKIGPTPTGTSRVHPASPVRPRTIMVAATAVVLTTCALAWRFADAGARTAGGAVPGSIALTSSARSDTASRTAQPDRVVRAPLGPPVANDGAPNKPPTVAPESRQRSDAARKARASGQRASTGDADSPADPFEEK